MAEVGDGAAPGALLRAARERQGMHIAMLAAALKVPQVRLEALEAGRLQDLPDATFARALAQSVCRVLKLDPAPVLAQLPQPRPTRLEKVASGLNTPFRDRPGHVIPADWAPWRKPALWLAGLLVAGAAAFVLLPPRAVAPPPAASAPAAVMPAVIASAVAVAASAANAAASAAAAAASTLAEPIGAAAPAAPAASVAAASADAPASTPAAQAGDAQAAVLVAVQPTWVQVVDAGGKVLLSRLVPAGETVELAGATPIRVRIGNAAGTRLRWHGQPVDLAPLTRDNVVTVELR